MKIEPQLEPSLVKMADDFDFESVMAKAAALADNYAVVFIHDEKVLGSGTLVAVDGVHGIVTAHHVADVLYRQPDGEFCLCIRGDVAHRLEVSVQQLQHIVVGDFRRNRFEHTGPDLSFLMITDAELTATLARKKSFYPLIQKGNIAAYPLDKLRKLPFIVAGSPQELARDAGPHRGMKLTKIVHLQMNVLCRSLQRNNGFDYLRLEVGSGVQEFPREFGGVSGGGIWMPVGQVNENGQPEFYPVLQGVIFYQSRPYENNTRRLLIGHGPESIYSGLIERLRPT